ncbi:MAG TPA: matrixin family metalloprotease, partial [Polyangiaceae bacterium]|nr:matrixin family metalloprotease [Polyangiaceae bacterium]
MLLLLLGSAALDGCFFYDSSWGAAKASQKRVVAQRTPSELRRERPPRTTESLRIRAYATPHYAAALVDGEAQFRQALADANPTLASALSFQLELSEYRVWSNRVSDDRLDVLLHAIEQQDPARDVDWVVILASPRQMVATSADELGMAPLLGRHLAIRAMSDAAEFDVIERGFNELSDDEKRTLYDARKRHKAATVLLHELGHTLGMPHELDRHSMMSAVY